MIEKEILGVTYLPENELVIPESVQALASITMFWSPRMGDLSTTLAYRAIYNLDALSQEEISSILSTPDDYPDETIKSLRGRVQIPASDKVEEEIPKNQGKNE